LVVSFQSHQPHWLVINVNRVTQVGLVMTQ
jgi:hypothetical protein